MSGYWSSEIYSGMIASVFLFYGVYIGHQFISAGTQQKVYSKAFLKTDLTERELEVLALASEGLSNKEIADRLFISVPTVKTHLSNCYLKLNVKRRTQALLKAKELELL